MKIVYKYLVLFMVLPLFSCGGGGDDPTPPEPEPEVPAPSAATLIYPDNNEACTEGVLVSETESQVTFEWTASENTDTYTLVLTNLETGAESSTNTSNIDIQVTLERGTAYSWSIVSSAEGTNETASSEIWRFYNAGATIENYAPFPAYEPYPKMGEAINSGTISLAWEGADLDGDALSYTIYLGTSSPPSSVLGETDANSFETTINADTVYYWQVVTVDSAGNSSTSEIFEFKTNP